MPKPNATTRPNALKRVSSGTVMGRSPATFRRGTACRAPTKLLILCHLPHGRSATTPGPPNDLVRAGLKPDATRNSNAPTHVRPASLHLSLRPHTAAACRWASLSLPYNLCRNPTLLQDQTHRSVSSVTVGRPSPITSCRGTACRAPTHHPNVTTIIKSDTITNDILCTLVRRKT